jgi:hypothetical protein
VSLFLLFLYFVEQGKIKVIPRGLAKKTTFIILLIFIGLRGFVYTDWVNYYPFYEELPTIWDSNFLSIFSSTRVELGFVLYRIIIKSIFSNYFIWIFICSLLDLLCLSFLFLRYSNSYILSFILFFCFYGLNMEFNLLRNIKAILLFLLSIESLLNRKMIRYTLLNLIGISFHYSSLLFLPLYFILNKKFNAMIIWSIFLASNIIFLFDIHLAETIINSIFLFTGGSSFSEFSSNMHKYIETSRSYELTIGYFERSLSYILFAILYKKMIDHKSINVIMLNAYFCYYFLFIFFSNVSILMIRYSSLFVFSYWFLYPNVIALLRSIRYKKILQYLIIIICIYKTIASNQTILSLYDNIIWGTDNYEERFNIFREYSDIVL